MAVTLKSKKQPDRFARMVEKAAGDGWSGDAWAVSAVDAAKLLRAEHAAYVRLVKAQERYGMGVHIMLPKQYGAWINMEELLAALARRIK